MPAQREEGRPCVVGLVAVLVFALVVAIFALQNAEPVRIAFLWWTVPRVSEALIILGSVLLGVLGALFGRGWRRWRRRPAAPAAPPVAAESPGAATPEGAPTPPETDG